MWRIIHHCPASSPCYEWLFSALHYNLELSRVQTIGFAHVVHLTTSYSCLSISSAFWGLRGFPEVAEVFWEFGSNPDCSVVQREGA